MTVVESKYEYGDQVRIKSKIKSEELHYGYLEDFDIFKNDTATVQKGHFSNKANEWSYLVRFNNMEMDNEHWFLESELCLKN